MTIANFLKLLWRRRLIIVLTAAVTIAVVAARTSALAPVYRSSAVLRVATSAIGSFEYLQYDVTYANRLMNTYKHLALSGPVIGELVEELNLTELPKIDVESIEDSELLTITVEDTNARLAADTANALAGILITQIEQMSAEREQSASEVLEEQLTLARQELEKTREDYAQLASLYADTDQRVIAANRTMLLNEQIYANMLDQYEGTRVGELVRANSVSLIDRAAVPALPISPNVPLNLGLGALLGLAVGLAIAILVENSDTTLYTTQAIQGAVETDVLGAIPKSNNTKLLTFSNSSSPDTEAYRSLRTNLFGLRTEVGIRSLVFTSAVPNEGKSTVVANLATAIAQSGRTVIVMDCDLRRPTLDKLFGVTSDYGLMNVLRKEVDLWEILVETDHPNLTLVTTGQPLPNNPSEVLTSSAFAEVLHDLLERADIVLIDAPALGPVTDAAVIAPIVDAAVLVVSRGRVKEEEVQAAYRRLNQVRAKNISVIVNRAERMASYT